MPKPANRSYSRYTQDAVQLIARLIRSSRVERKLTTQEVAERAGISRGLLQRIEKGDFKCGIGAVFEVATIVGVRLFDMEQTTLTKQIKRLDDKLTLLPKSIRKKPRPVNDDF